MSDPVRTTQPAVVLAVQVPNHHGRCAPVACTTAMHATRGRIRAQRARLLLPALALCIATPQALAASFVYEGTLDEHDRPASGRYDLRLSIAAAPQDAPALSTIEFPAVEVRDGRFRLAFDLPGLGTAEPWVGLAVRPAGESGFTEIPGRSKAAKGVITQCWGINGDAGTNANFNFLGTVDDEPLVLRVANARALRIEPSAVTFEGLPITANVIAGSRANSVAAGIRGATIAGGGLPSGDSDPLLSGEQPNRVVGFFGTVGGGYGNEAGAYATVGGGVDNVTILGGTIGGGEGNRVTEGSGTVAGGIQNTAGGGRWASVGGGLRNSAIAATSIVGGGTDNVASGPGSTVGGGERNSASGEGSTVGGGLLNCAGGQYSWAGGRSAKVRPGSGSGDEGDGCSFVASSGDADGDEGTFVWSDKSVLSPFVSTGPNQFLVRANGGVGINNAAIPAGIELLLSSRSTPNTNVDLFMRSSANSRGINLGMLPGTGSNPAEFRIAQFDGTSFTDRILLAANGNFTVTAEAFKPGGGSWAASSDARLKHHVAPLSGTLDRLLALTGVHFEYLDPDPAKRPAGTQVGFVAQDVQKVFPDWVSTDRDGYLMVAPRGFEALTVEALRELRAESATIDAGQADRLRALEAQNAALQARVDRLERLLQARVDAQDGDHAR